MAVIESKGDGFSLFNGVKLPSLPEYDNEIYSYAYVCKNINSYVFIGSTATFAMNEEGKLQATADVTFVRYTSSSGVSWSTVNQLAKEEGFCLPSNFIPIWSNHDILNTTDNSVHLAASEPIPLDGMNVIEWDGNTEGLHVMETVPDAYRVSSVTDVDISKPVVLIRHNTDDTKHILNKAMTCMEDGLYKHGYSRYISVTNETFSSSGVYFIKRSYSDSYMYGELLAYYPIEEVSGDKTTISFNNKEYSIDTAALSPATSALKSHLSTVMNGAGAVINLGGTAYNVDSAKLATATNAFVQHLGTIAGNGYKVVVGGVEYGVDAAKMTSAVTEIEAVLGGLHTDDDGSKSYTAGLYETGAIALYNEQGAEAIEGMMIKSWDELVSSGAIVIDNGVVSSGYIVPDNLPEKNEYGFYFDVPYAAVIFHEDGSLHIGEEVIPAGTIVYGANSIDMSALDMGVAQVSDDGRTLIFADFTVCLGERPNLDGDLFMSNSDNITEIGNQAFIEQFKLTNITIPEGVTSIGEHAFDGCSCLTNITIPSSVISIGEYAFRSCCLKSITIPEGVTTIGDGAFSDYMYLTSITIPSTVTAISPQLVMNCTNLTSITFGGTVEQWKAFTLPSNWNYNVPATYVQCSDGIVSLTGR